MRFLEAFRRRKSPPAPAPSRVAGDTPPEDEDGIAFHDLYQQVVADDRDERRRAAVLLKALTLRPAVRPLLRAYLQHGDRFLLETLASYGDKVTIVAGREVRNAARSTTERARLMTVLGETDDPAARDILWTAVGDYEAAVHVAACAALANMGDASALELLSEALLSTDVEMRRLALRATRDVEHPGVGRLQREHVSRYLAAGGAVPTNVTVSLPLLLDPERDVPRFVVEHVRTSPHPLTMVIGPDASDCAETAREALEEGLADRALFFTTRRHAPQEQFDVLMAARAQAVAERRRPAVFIGDLPSPRSLYPPPHFLIDPRDGRHSARIVFVGQQEFAVVMAWWYYIEDRSEVETDYHVLLTALSIAGDRMTEEERLTYEMLDDEQHEAFGRALLAHRAVVGDALEGRSWLY